MSGDVDRAMLWLRRHKPDGKRPIYHAADSARAASALLILAAMHDQGLIVVTAADVAMYSMLSTSATRARLDWLCEAGVVTRRKDRSAWVYALNRAATDFANRGSEATT